eukprot:scaffold151721_cov27-Attheya_sp.AAC.1
MAKLSEDERRKGGKRRSSTSFRSPDTIPARSFSYPETKSKKSSRRKTSRRRSTKRSRGNQTNTSYRNETSEKKSRFNTRPEKKKTRKKLDWRLLKNKEIRAKYNEALRTILEKETDGNGNAEVQYTDFMNATLQAAEDTIQGNGRISKD